jgi:hypothetical protein
MFFILLFNALLAMAELSASFESRPIMLKHKSLYAYLLQNTVQTLTLSAPSTAHPPML